MIYVGVFLAGVLVGGSLWFPYKHYLKKALVKKREVSKILNELEQNENTHRVAQADKKANVTTATAASMGSYASNAWMTSQQLEKAYNEMLDATKARYVKSQSASGKP